MSDSGYIGFDLLSDSSSMCSTPQVLCQAASNRVRFRLDYHVPVRLFSPTVEVLAHLSTTLNSTELLSGLSDEKVGIDCGIIMPYGNMQGSNDG